MTPSEIILIIIALSVLILVIFLAKFLYTACTTLKRVNRTLGAIQRQIDGLGHEPQHLIRHISGITGDVHKILRCCTPFFQAFSNTGEYFRGKSEKLKPCSNHSCSDDDETTTDVVKLCLLGFNLWKKIRKEGIS